MLELFKRPESATVLSTKKIIRKVAKSFKKYKAIEKRHSFVFRIINNTTKIFRKLSACLALRAE